MSGHVRVWATPRGAPSRNRPESVRAQVNRQSLAGFTRRTATASPAAAAALVLPSLWLAGGQPFGERPSRRPAPCPGAVTPDGDRIRTPPGAPREGGPPLRLLGVRGLSRDPFDQRERYGARMPTLWTRDPSFRMGLADFRASRSHPSLPNWISKVSTLDMSTAHTRRVQPRQTAFRARPAVSRGESEATQE